MVGEFRIRFKYKMAIVGDCFLGRLEHRLGAGGCYSVSRRTAPARFASALRHRSRRRLALLALGSYSRSWYQSAAGHRGKLYRLSAKDLYYLEDQTIGKS
jgi:hypothetical protein